MVSAISLHFHVYEYIKIFLSINALRYYFMSSVKTWVHFYQVCVLPCHSISSDPILVKWPRIGIWKGFYIQANKVKFSVYLNRHVIIISSSFDSSERLCFVIFSFSWVSSHVLFSWRVCPYPDLFTTVDSRRMGTRLTYVSVPINVMFKEVYEVGLEFEVWGLVFDLFRSSKV